MPWASFKKDIFRKSSLVASFFETSSSYFLVAKMLTQVFLIPYARQLFTHNPRWVVGGKKKWQPFFQRFSHIRDYHEAQWERAKFTASSGHSDCGLNPTAFLWQQGSGDPTRSSPESVSCRLSDMNGQGWKRQRPLPTGSTGALSSFFWTPAKAERELSTCLRHPHPAKTEEREPRSKKHNSRFQIHLRNISKGKMT